jgi:hypothetical protein
VRDNFFLKIDLLKKEYKKKPVRGFFLIHLIKVYWNNCGANWLRYTLQFLQVCPPSDST